jgi:predicted TPR repeat methyltransferase
MHTTSSTECPPVESSAVTVEARLKLGIELQDSGRLAQAAEVLGQLVVDYPNCAAGWVQLARAIAPEGFAWEAHQAVARALKGKPDSQTLVTAATVLMTLEDLAGANSATRRAVKLTPRSVSAWIQRGLVLSADGRGSEAAEAYQQALANEPGNAVARFLLSALDGRSAAATAPPEYVRTLFDGCAEQFEDRLVTSLQYRVPQLLEQILSRWLKRTGAEPVKPMAMLDAGCGTGLCAQWLAQHRGQLIGVDLSSRMIAKADARNIYDELIAGEVVCELEKRPGALDLILASDVLVYFGDLTRVFAAAAAALRTGGVFVLSVEAGADAEFVLQSTQRFAHSMGYLNRLAASNDLSVRETEEAVLRLEKGVEVRGHLMLAEKRP